MNIAGKKVVVIGSGVGGAAIAALLAAKGCEVTVLERNKYLGGRAATSKRDGFTIDNGVHVCLRGDKGPFGEINRRVGGDLQFLKVDPYLHLYLTHNGYVYLDMRPWKQRARIAWMAGVQAKGAIGALRAILSLLKMTKESDVEPYDEIPLKEWLSRYTDDKGLHGTIATFATLLTGCHYTEASAGEFMWGFATWFEACSTSYPKGGYNEVCASFLRVLERKGGKVEYDAEVKRIIVEGGRAVGVETADKTYMADAIVSNASIVSTVKMAGKSNFNPSYVRKVLALKNSPGIATIRYALDKEVAKLPFYAFGLSRDMDPMALISNPEKEITGDEMVIYMVNNSLFDPTLAPKGKQMVSTAVFVPAEPEKDDYCHRVLDKVDRKIQKLWPELKGHVMWEMRTTPLDTAADSGRLTGEAVGLAQTYTQCGKNKPNPKMPIDSLYLCSCDAGGRGAGTEQAADSALKVSEIILRDMKARGR